LSIALVSAINKETSRSLALDIAAERILTVLADKSDGLWDQKSSRRPNRATESWKERFESQKYLNKGKT
jgi:hypothetical protein